MVAALTLVGRAAIAATAISLGRTAGSYDGETLRTCVNWPGALSSNGIDLVLAVSLRCGEVAAAELAAIPAPPDLKAVDKEILRPVHTDAPDECRDQPTGTSANDADTG
jgi:hypothetical protein